MEDTDGLDLSWGNAETMVALTEKIAKRVRVHGLVREIMLHSAGVDLRSLDGHVKHLGEEPNQEIVARHGAPCHLLAFGGELDIFAKLLQDSKMTDFADIFFKRIPQNHRFCDLRSRK